MTRGLRTALSTFFVMLVLVVPAAFGQEAFSETVGGVFDAQKAALDEAAVNQWLVGSEGRVAVDGLVTAPDADRLDQLENAPKNEGRLEVGLNTAVQAVYKLAGLEGKASVGSGFQTFAKGAGRIDANGFVWFTSVRSTGASAIRLHFADFSLPEGAEMYVYNRKGEAFGPYSGNGIYGNGEFWSHTLLGEEIRLQIRYSGSDVAEAVAAIQFDIAEVAHFGSHFLLAKFRGGDRGDLGLDPLAKAFCSSNASCVNNAGCASIPSAIQPARNAVAHIQFAVGGSNFICSGGLINDTDTSSTIPYFLTANHCLSTAASASSVEAFFQFSTNCGANCFAANNSLPRMLGSSLQAGSASTDFTLLRLNGSIPAGLTLLGWTTAPVANSNGTSLFRVSHPKGAPQAYSTQDVSTSAGTCGSLPRGNFIYSRDTSGATEGGSSGSPILNSSGQIVGQLFGACGTNLNNVCDSASNATVDGAFAATFSSVSQFLDNSGGGGCHPDVLGGFNYCRTGCKCDAGEGDCDNDNECNAGLTCVDNIGAQFGFGSNVDVCQAGSNPNSCVGNCGGQAPGGCWCDSQCAGFGDCCSDKVAACGN